MIQACTYHSHLLHMISRYFTRTLCQIDEISSLGPLICAYWLWKLLEVICKDLKSSNRHLATPHAPGVSLTRQTFYTAFNSEGMCKWTTFSSGCMPCFKCSGAKYVRLIFYRSEQNSDQLRCDQTSKCKVCR